MKIVHSSAVSSLLPEFPYGIFLLAIETDAGPASVIVTWVAQLSFVPPMLSVSIESESKMKVWIDRERRFSLNLLRTGDAATAKKYAAGLSSADRPNTYGFSPTGVPVVPGALGWLECRIENSVPAGDHTLYLATITDALREFEGAPLTQRETAWTYKR